VLRHWWLAVLAVVLLLLGIGVGAVAWDRYTLRGSEEARGSAGGAGSWARR